MDFHPKVPMFFVKHEASESPGDMSDFSCFYSQRSGG